MMEGDNNYTSPSIVQDVTLHSPASTMALEGQIMYKAVVQGIFALCLSSVVGGVMIFFICLYIIKEFKLFYVWTMRTHHKEECPPSYVEATKPPSYTDCITQESGPPEYSQMCFVQEGMGDKNSKESYVIKDDVESNGTISIESQL